MEPKPVQGIGSRVQASLHLHSSVSPSPADQDVYQDCQIFDWYGQGVPVKVGLMVFRSPDATGRLLTIYLTGQQARDIGERLINVGKRLGQ